MARSLKTDSNFPTREELATFIANNPGKNSKRDIVRAFKMGPSARILLKRVLKEMEADGDLSRERSTFVAKDQLPPVLVVDIKSFVRSRGEYTAVPANGSKENQPTIWLLPPKSGGRGSELKIGGQALVRIEATKHANTYRGRIIKVLSREENQVLGILRERAGGFHEIEPVDKRNADKFLMVPPGEEKDARDGDLVAVDVLKGDRRTRIPRARVRERIGNLGTEKSLSMIALHAHDIPYVFSDAVLREADAAEPATLKGREDWRKIPLVTIDPADAKDHDDAVFAEEDTDPNNLGGYIVTVAIADVASYVTPHSALDKTALERGNSVYFPGRVVPMLPERISNDLCSLRPDENRPALAVRMVIDKGGHKKSHTFHRVLMRSAAKLSYEQAQAAIDGNPDDTTQPLLEPVLKPLWAAYACIKKARDQRSPLDLNLPERKIILKESGAVERVLVPPRLDAHRLIEECMILANVSAAETLLAKSIPQIFRVHEAPSQEKLAGLRNFLLTLEIAFAKSDEVKTKHFNHLLAHVKESEHEPLVNEVVLRSQSQAEYASKNRGHFGLALQNYAHFTSPIRRYADLVVHRALVTAHGWGEDGLEAGTTVELLQPVAEAISQAERRAMAAERETTDRLIAHHLAEHVGAEFTARIAGVTRSGLFVALHETGAQGYIPAATLGRDYYAFDERNHALVSERTGETYRLGDNVEVRLVEALPAAGALRFEMLTKGKKGRRFVNTESSRKHKREHSSSGNKRRRR